MKRSKYRAIPTVVDGIRFPSKLEAAFYGQLKLRRDQDAGDVRYFLRQVPFDLPGGVRYVCDFAAFMRDGSVKYYETKGMKTAMYRLKKKQAEAIYPVTITEVSNDG